MYDIKEEDILYYISKNKTQREIADIYGASRSTIVNRIHKIDPAKLEQARQKAREAEAREILELRKQKSVKEIAKLKNETEASIYGKIARSNKSEEVKIIQKMKDKKALTFDEVERYRTIINREYHKITYQEIALLVNAYIRTKQIEEAIRFLDTILNAEGLEHLDIEKIKNAKIQVEQIQKRQMARNLVRQGKKIYEIMETTNLKVKEILDIKQEMGQRIGPVL